jgi:hypothetical protein
MYSLVGRNQPTTNQEPSKQQETVSDGGRLERWHIGTANLQEKESIIIHKKQG